MTLSLFTKHSHLSCFLFFQFLVLSWTHLSEDKNNEEQTKLYHTVIHRWVSGKILHNLYEVALQNDLDYLSRLAQFSCKS